MVPDVEEADLLADLTDLLGDASRITAVEQGRDVDDRDLAERGLLTGKTNVGLSAHVVFSSWLLPAGPGRGGGDTVLVDDPMPRVRPR